LGDTKNVNVITGTPRSGSTLLCNLLNQHPHMYASSTSMLPAFVQGIVHTYSTSSEIKSDLINNREAAEARIDRVTKTFIDSWYIGETSKDMIFDKSRGWLPVIPVLKKLYPHSKVVVTIRDPRGILGSIEKQNAKNPLLDANKEKSITKRVEELFGDEGMAGAPLRGIEDSLRRKMDVFYLKFENFVDTPLAVLAALHDFLGIDNFKHDLDNIKNTATDVDALYLFKYPHHGSGKIVPPPSNEWKQYFSDDVAATLLSHFPLYCQNFGYR
jgi:sulfotransferase